MKSIKLLLIFFIAGVSFNSCTVQDIIYEASLEEIVSEYDLWYIDYHRTTGNGNVPFLSKAFTISFLNGQMYANNNITDIGFTGNGLGIKIGNYDTYNGFLETFHTQEGITDFEVYQISANEIRIEDVFNNVSYYLIGYQIDNFDYDKLFYENIEYFLQEYVAWEKVNTTISGFVSPFDDENYLQFTPESNRTFYASKDFFGADITILDWDFAGSYEVFDVQNYDDLKILTLNYDNGDTEEFELSILNDSNIRLYDIHSQTTYDFRGRGFIEYQKGVASKSTIRNSGRKRIKAQRKIKVRRYLK
jgi:hypothetical protein